jgi:phage terminase large subunit GpA-like protein
MVNEKFYQKLVELRTQILKPQPKLSLVEWADEYRYLSPESSSISGKWRTDVVEVARGPMMAITEPGIKKITLMAPTQLMKALDLEEVLPTPSGWTTVRDVKVGDILFDEMGQLCKVIGKSDVANNQTAEIEFSDGTKIICDLGHRWTVKDYTDSENVKIKTLTTEQMILNFKIGTKRNRYAIPITKAIDGETKELPIDPYVLGYWLGDGHSYSSRITCGTDDFESLKENFKNRGYSLISSESKHPTVKESRVHDYDGSIHSKLLHLNLIKNKHIPNEYLRGSVNQRLELFRGLMDSDGTAYKNGNYCSITMKSEILFHGILELINSLGIKPAKQVQRIKYKDEYRNYFIIGFTTYSENRIFNLKRKQERIDNRRVGLQRKTVSQERRIVSIEKKDIREVQCLMVDSPSHLFLCSKSFIATHNTEFINNVVGYFIHQDPAPMIVSQPTTKNAEAWSKDRLEKMIRDTPVLNELVAEKRSRDSQNTITHKTFKGGHITVVGANAPSDLAMRPVRIILADEIDKYPPSAGKEGDPLSLLQERTTTFWNALHVAACTPTIANSSRIEDEFKNSDMRYFHAKCVHCQKFIKLDFKFIRYDEKNPKDAYYQCQECKVPWTEIDRLKSISAGKYIATKKFEGHAGFHCNRIASPWSSLGDMMKKYESVKDNPQKLKTFVNTQLAETWTETGEQPDNEVLENKIKTYSRNQIPTDEIAFLTMGIDVQKFRLEMEIVGWTKDKKSYSIDYRIIGGEVVKNDPWNEVDKILKEEWTTPNGRKLKIALCCVDTGFATKRVYQWALTHPSTRVRPIKGNAKQDKAYGQPNKIIFNLQGQAAQRSIMLFAVGVDLLKDEFYGYLQMTGDDTLPGRCFFPDYDPEFFKGICAEKKVEKEVNGKKVYHWIKAHHKNEPLDCRIYAMAAAEMYGISRFTPEEWSKLLNFGVPLDKGGTLVKGKQEKNLDPEENEPNRFWSRTSRGVF